MFDPDYATNNRRWWKTAAEHCFTAAAWLFRHGVQIAVIEGNGLYAAEAVNDVLRAVGSYSRIHHITLDAELDVVAERVQRRGDLDEHPRDFLAGWLQLIRVHIADWTHVIDSSNLTPVETLERIYKYINASTGIAGAIPLDP